jgi:hypothetical protein
MAASMFESDLIATLAQIPVGQFTDRFRKRDFGLMPFFWATRYQQSVSRAVFNDCLCTATNWKTVDNLLASKSQTWLSGPISRAEAEKLKEIHLRACTLLKEMCDELLRGTDQEQLCTE